MGGTVDDFCGELRHTSTMTTAYLEELKVETQEMIDHPEWGMGTGMTSRWENQLDIINEELDERTEGPLTADGKLWSKA